MHGAPRASLRRPVTMEAPMPVRDQSPFGVAVGGIHTSLVAVEAYVTEDGGVGVGADNGRSLAVPVCDVYLRKGEIDILPRPLQEATATLPPTRLLLLLLAARRARHRGRRHRPWHHLVLPFLIDAIILRFLVLLIRLFSFPFPLILLRHANATSSSVSTPVHPTLGHAPRGAPLAGGDGVARPGALRPPRRWRLAALAEQPPGVARHQEVGGVHLGIALPAQARLDVALTRVGEIPCFRRGPASAASLLLGPRDGHMPDSLARLVGLSGPPTASNHIFLLCVRDLRRCKRCHVLQTLLRSFPRIRCAPRVRAPRDFFERVVGGPGKWGTSGDEGASGISLATIPILSHAGSVDFGRPGHRITIRRRRAPDRRLRWPVTSVWAMKTT
ncbi:hypothetical protein GW17_00008134 [Ensete ventricosum]|nr:hypothetical protein GW17_00008134 [Ensete ventricosum]